MWLASGREGGDDLSVNGGFFLDDLKYKDPGELAWQCVCSHFPAFMLRDTSASVRSSCTGYWVCMGNWITSTVSLHECDNPGLTPLFEN